MEFWYLTVYYIVPWLLLPLSAVLWNRLGAKPSAGGDNNEPTVACPSLAFGRQSVEAAIRERVRQYETAHNAGDADAE